MEYLKDGKTKTIAKGTILLNKGGYIQGGYKVLRGCLKSYVIDKSGKEHILQFAPEDWIISDMKSSFYGAPSSIYIEAIEESEVMLLTIEMFDTAMKNGQEVLLEQNHKLIRSLIASNKRLIALLSETAEERYVDFTLTYPSLVQRFPLKLIASYLGITPEYLSEIRRKIARQ